MTRTITPTTPTTTARALAGVDVDRLAADLDRHGVAAVATELDDLARRAHALGVAAPSLQALADTTAPAVVRARAFDHVVRHLSHLGMPTSADALVAVA